MFLALRLAFSRWRSRAGASSDQAAERAAEAPPGDAAEALWREARTEPSPFRRDALYLEIASLMVDLAGPELLAFCGRHVADATLAEDLAQRAFIELWQALPRFEGRSTLRTFLFGIALNLCRRATRSEQRERARLDVHEDRIRDEIHPEPLAEVDHQREHRERVIVLERTLTMMDARDAWLLRARLVDELSYGEILPRYQARFGAHITTHEGLRTAFFHARKELERRLRGPR